MNKNEYKHFLNGFAAAVAFVIRDHGETTIGLDAMECYSISLKDLEEAGCDEFDMKPIQKAFAEEEGRI